MRKLFVTLMCVVMVVALMPAMAFAATSVTVSNEDDLINAIKNMDDGTTILLANDIELSKTLAIDKEGSFVIDGQGHKITLAKDFTNNDTAIMFGNSGYNDEHVKTRKFTIKNIIFDGHYGGSIIRSQGVTLTMDGCQFINFKKNDSTTYEKAVVRIDYTEANVLNCSFENNDSTMTLYFNYNADSSKTTLTVDNCLFENNKSFTTCILYYVTGSSCEVKNSEFINNKTNSDGNGATAYFGFKKNCTIKNCLFEGNTVDTTSATTKRVGGAIMVGNAGNVSNNAFIGNIATRNGVNDGLAQVATSIYYADIDLSGNYWGGKEPVEGVDYTVEHTQNKFNLDTYFDSYKLDENGNVVVYNYEAPKIEVEDTTAKVPENVVTDAIEKAEGKKDVVISTETSEPVKSVEIPVVSVESVANADKNLVVETEVATVTLDKKTLDTIADKAEGEVITLQIETVKAEDLNKKQQETVKKLKAEVVISAEILSNGKVISQNFGGGKVKIELPFTLPTGTKGEDFTVAYIANDGTVTKIDTEYVDGKLVFELEHFSEYAVVKTADFEKLQATETPKTGDTNTMMPWLAVMAVAAAGAVVLRKKEN